MATVINLKKRESIKLSKVEKIQKSLTVAVKWNTIGVDLDLSAFAYRRAGQLDADCVLFYDQPIITGLKHSGDVKGKDSSHNYAESININLHDVLDNYEEVIFLITAYEARKRKFKFGNAVINADLIVDGEVVISSAIGDTYPTEYGIKLASIKKVNGELTYTFLGEAEEKELGDYLRENGIQVEE